MTQKKRFNKILFNKLIFYGLHLGGLKSFWNPSMKPYIASFRNDFCILDLSLTQRCIREGFRFLLKIVISNKKIIFIGGPKGLERNFSILCQRHGHLYIDSYTDGLFSNYSSQSILDEVNVERTPSLIFFFDASVREKQEKNF